MLSRGNNITCNSSSWRERAVSVIRARRLRRKNTLGNEPGHAFTCFGKMEERIKTKIKDKPSREGTKARISSPCKSSQIKSTMWATGPVLWKRFRGFLYKFKPPKELEDLVCFGCLWPIGVKNVSTNCLWKIGIFCQLNKLRNELLDIISHAIWTDHKSFVPGEDNQI